jgi:hypothetical protein
MTVAKSTAAVKEADNLTQEKRMETSLHTIYHVL